MVRSGEAVEVFPRPAGLSKEGSAEMTMQISFGGYAMAITDRFDIFVYALLLLYTHIAFIHTI